MQRINTIKQVGFLCHLNLSINMETTVSISEIEDVSAAKSTRTKKTVPIMLPPAMLSKTLGRVTNIRPGPLPKALSSPPENEKTAGITIRPAKNAIPVSKSSICLTAPSMATSFFIYEP